MKTPIHILPFITKLTSNSVFQTILGIIIVLVINVLIFSVIYFLIYKADEKISFFASDLYKTRSKIIADSELKLVPDLDPRWNVSWWSIFSAIDSNSGMPSEFYKSFIGDLTYEQLINIYLPKYMDMVVRLLPFFNQTIQAMEMGDYQKMWRQEAWHSSLYILNPNSLKNFTYNDAKLQEILHWNSLLGKDWEAFKKNYGDQESFKIADNMHQQLLSFWKSGEKPLPFQKFWVEVFSTSNSIANLLTDYIEIPPLQKDAFEAHIKKELFTNTSRQIRLDTRNLSPKLNYWDFFYYSIVNVATNRYGDIVPVSSCARMISTFQALISYFILAFAVIILNERWSNS